ncbi:MAG: DUF3352 domain-containing protein [Verrucomicrobia bacterium]|nr:DUF3352 domain-containing protein [Verrucomicrobiota bacterium]
MKRAFLMLMVLAAMPAASFAAASQEPKTFAGSVPEGAVFYATTQNLESVWAGIERSNFWAKLTRLKIWEGADFGWYDDFRHDFADKLGFEFNTQSFMAVFGREIAVALYVEPPADAGGNTRIELLCAARMNPRDTVEDMVQKLLDRAKTHGADNVLVTSVDYRGAKVQTLKTKDNEPPLQLRFAMQGDVLFVGIANGVPRIEACLDCLAGEGTPIAGADEFKHLMAQARQAHGAFFSEMYLSLDALQRMVEMETADNAALSPLGQALQMMSGSIHAVAVTTHLDRGLRMKFAFEPGPAMEEMMALLQKTEPRAGAHAKYVSPDAIFYYGANNMPPLAEQWPLSMKQYEQMGMGLDERIARVIEQVELALEIDFKADVLDNVGPEMAVVLEGFDLEAAPFPFPKLTVLLQVKDKAKTEALIGKAVKLLETVSTEDRVPEVTDLTHQGATLKVLRVPVPMFQITLTPAVGVTESFLFVSSGEPYAKATLDAAKSGSSLFNSPLYRSLDIPEKTNNIFLINVEKLLGAGRQIAQWVVTMAEMQGQGEMAKEQVDGTVLPLLDCLGALKAIAAYSVVGPEGVIGVYVIRTEDLPAE